MAEAELEFLRAKLAGLMRDDEEAVPQRPKVIEPLNLEGVASHIKKIRSSNDSMLTRIDQYAMDLGIYVNDSIVEASPPLIITLICLVSKTS